MPVDEEIRLIPFADPAERKETIYLFNSRANETGVNQFNSVAYQTYF